MASSKDELSVRITGDASGLERATAEAASSLTNLQSEVDNLNAETADVTVTADAGSAQQELAAVESQAESLDKTPVEISPALELSRINRDIANLNRALDGIERRKANPDVGLDITQLLRDEARVRKELDNLSGRKVEAEAALNVQPAGFANMQNMLDNLDSSIAGISPRLAGMAGMLRGGVAPAAAVAGGAFAAWKLGELAGDVESLRIQLDAVFGSGDQVLNMLRDWANEAPFGLDATAQAARTLGLAGVKLQDMTDVLDSLGTAASLAPGDLNQNLISISTVVSQMLNKGHIMAEEVQQLAEQGVPAWQALAQSQGTSVAKVQQLTTEGKLGRQAIMDFAAEFQKMFPTAMADQADSFNGKMSTLNDTWTQAGANLGNNLLPELKLLQDSLIAVGGAAIEAEQAAQWLSGGEGSPLAPSPIDKSASLWDKFKDSVTDAGKALFTGAQPVQEQATAMDDLGDKTGKAADKNRDLQSSAQDAGPSISQLGDTARKAAEDYSQLLDSFSAVDQAMVDSRSTVYDYQGALDDLRSSLAKGASFAPTAEQGRANWDALVRVAGTASDRIQSALETGGADAAEAVYRSTRRAMFNLLHEAHVKPREAWRLVDQVLEKPHQMHIELNKTDQARLTAELARLTRKKARVEATLQIPEPEGAVNQAMINAQQQLKPLQAKINATTQHLDQSKAELDALAKPGGNPRTAPIEPTLDPTSLAQTRKVLAELAAPETKTIKVHLQENPTGQTLNPQDFRSGILGGSGGTVTFTGATMREPVKVRSVDPTPLMPRQTPVKVYLDGAEIADHLELQARRVAAAGSTRRLP